MVYDCIRGKSDRLPGLSPMEVQHLQALDLRENCKRLVQLLDPDPDRPGLVETPTRMAEAWEFFTSGYAEKPEFVLKTFEDGASGYDAMVMQGGIPIYSQCEHHLVPFFGVGHIAYIPSGKVVGLSKLKRLVEIFARRLQVQERLTVQIADALQNYLSPVGVGVTIRCRHLCMESRGVQTAGTITYTSALRGAMLQSGPAREEYMQFVTMSDKDLRL